MAQWLGLDTLTAKGLGSVLGWGTKIPQAAQCSQNKKIRGHSPKSPRWQGWLLLETLGRVFSASLPASGGCRQYLVFLGLEPHHSNLCLHHHVTFFPVGLLISVSTNLS